MDFQMAVLTLLRKAVYYSLWEHELEEELPKEFVEKIHESTAVLSLRFRRQQNEDAAVTIVEGDYGRRLFLLDRPPILYDPAQPENIFDILRRSKKVLYPEEFHELFGKVTESGSYEKAIEVIGQYVIFVQ